VAYSLVISFIDTMSIVDWWIVPPCTIHSSTASYWYINNEPFQSLLT
jgi:hypothetical protein